MTAALLDLTPRLPQQPQAGMTLAEIDAEVAAIRSELRRPLERLARLREAGAHLTAFGPACSWHEAVERWLGDLRTLRLSGSAEAVAEREALIYSMREAGLATRPIRERLGVSSDSVAKALAKADPAPERIIGADGAERAARTGRSAPQAAPEGRVWQQAAEWLRRAAAGELRGIERGLTLAELARLAGWSEGKASGALTDLLRRRLAERSEERRSGMRVHLHRAEPLA